MPRREIYNVFFFGFLLAILYGILRVLEPFAGALLGALVIAVTVDPLYERMRAWRWAPRRSENMRASCMVLIVLVFLVVPIALIGWSLVSESESLASLTKGWSQTLAEARRGRIGADWPWMQSLRWWMQRALGVGPRQFHETILMSVTGALGVVAQFGRQAAQHAIGFLFETLLMLFTLFFFLRDGRRLTGRLEALFPMRTEDTRAVFHTVHDTIVGVVRGWLLTAVVQGACAALGYGIVGLDGAVLFGVLTAAVGLLPVVGTFGVWVPIALFFFGRGMMWQGFFTLAWGTLIVVGLIDTFVRPYLVGRKAELPLLYLFFALLGGAEVFGAKGIILGPLLFALAPVLFDIYKRRFLLGSGETAVSAAMGGA